MGEDKLNTQFKTQKVKHGTNRTKGANKGKFQSPNNIFFSGFLEFFWFFNVFFRLLIFFGFLNIFEFFGIFNIFINKIKLWTRSDPPDTWPDSLWPAWDFFPISFQIFFSYFLSFFGFFSVFFLFFPPTCFFMHVDVDLFMQFTTKPSSMPWSLLGLRPTTCAANAKDRHRVFTLTTDRHTHRIVG